MTNLPFNRRRQKHSSGTAYWHARGKGLRALSRAIYTFSTPGLGGMPCEAKPGATAGRVIGKA